MIFKALKRQITKALRGSSLLADLAVAGTVIPLFTYIAWATRSKPSPIYDWQFDRLLKREAYYTRKDPTHKSWKALRTRYLLNASQILNIDSSSSISSKKLKEALLDLSFVQNCVGDNPRMRAVILDDEFMKTCLKLAAMRSRIEEFKSRSLLLDAYVLEESIANLFLVLSLDPNTDMHKKYEKEITVVMKDMQKEREPYSLRNALADCYFFNMTSKDIVYNEHVIPMNPERARNYDTDIVFIHGGNHSHCFNTWRVLRQSGEPSERTRTFKLSTLWPPKFLPDRHNSRLLALKYNVRLVLNVVSAHEDDERRDVQPLG
eukprot:TRINITY_DN1176_c0_g1_i7.p1 TRINITY_DN1176_c0_g1~~TRINITY_DN1176_c0_g1_i7.p1  ORF type:complete len:319 (+),score=48.58 TRINITY_DN1176_c0_g1_i7:190-1146(+)